MKKRLSTILLLVLVVCFASSMLIFTACNNDKKTENHDPKTVITKTSKMLQETVNNIKNGFGPAQGEKFGADINLDLVIDDKIMTEKNVKFTLVAKSNIDITTTENESASAFIIELGMQKGEADKEVLLGIGFDTQLVDGRAMPYLYVNLANGGYRKINAVSMGTMMKVLSGLMNPDKATTAAEIGMDEIIALAAPILFGETGSVKGNVYTYNIDLPKILTGVQANLETIFGALKMEIKSIDGIVERLFGGMEFQNASGVTTTIDSLSKTLDFLKLAFANEKGNLIMTFNDDKIFQKADLTLNKVKKLSMGNIVVDTFAGMIPDEVRKSDAVNLMTFQIEGVATGLTNATEGKDAVIRNYTYSINSDINPMNLLKLLDKSNQNPTAIKEILATLGYFNFTIDEVFEGKDSFNIFTIHADFADRQMLVNIDLYDTSYSIATLDVALGGYYDIDAMVDLVAMMIADKKLTPETPGVTEPGGTVPPEEKPMDIMALLGKMLGAFDAKNMHENGVTIDTNILADTLLTAIAGNLEYKSVLMPVLGSDFLKVKVQQTKFGECERVEESTIAYTLRSKKELKAVEYNGMTYELESGTFIKEITNIDQMNIRPVYDFNSSALEPQNAHISIAGLTNGKPISYLLKGTTIAGAEVWTTGDLIASTFDGTKVGKQQVTLYIAIDSVLYGTLGLVEASTELRVDKRIPLQGVLTYTIEVEVLAYDSEATVTADVRKIDKFLAINDPIFDTVLANLDSDWPKYLYVTPLFDQLELVKGEKITFKVSPELNGNREYKLGAECIVIYDESGVNDVTSTVLDEKTKIIKSGKYQLAFKYLDYVTKKTPIEIDMLTVQTVSGKGVSSFDKLPLNGVVEEYIITETLADGKTKILENSTVYKIDKNEYTSLDAFCDLTQLDGKNVYTMNLKNVALIGKDVAFHNDVVTTNEYSFRDIYGDEIIANYVRFTPSKSGKIVAPENVAELKLTNVTASNLKQNESINGKFTITYDGEIYNVTVEEIDGVLTLVAKTAGGKQIDSSVKIKLSFAGSDKDKDVELGSDGIFKTYNFTTGTMKPVTKFVFTVNIDGSDYYAEAISICESVQKSRDTSVDAGKHVGSSFSFDSIVYLRNGKPEKLYLMYIDGSYAICYSVVNMTEMERYYYKIEDFGVTIKANALSEDGTVGDIVNLVEGKLPPNDGAAKKYRLTLTVTYNGTTVDCYNDVTQK